jgi:hypothetical protein
MSWLRKWNVRNRWQSVVYIIKHLTHFSKYIWDRNTLKPNWNWILCKQKPTSIDRATEQVGPEGNIFRRSLLPISPGTSGVMTGFSWFFWVPPDKCRDGTFEFIIHQSYHLTLWSLRSQLEKCLRFWDSIPRLETTVISDKWWLFRAENETMNMDTTEHSVCMNISCFMFL